MRLKPLTTQRLLNVHQKPTQCDVQNMFSTTKKRRQRTFNNVEHPKIARILLSDGIKSDKAIFFPYKFFFKRYYGEQMPFDFVGVNRF